VRGDFAFGGSLGDRSNEFENRGSKTCDNRDAYTAKKEMITMPYYGHSWETFINFEEKRLENILKLPWKM